jgi:Zn-dependent peptidase ImmA (M78 family)
MSEGAKQVFDEWLTPTHHTRIIREAPMNHAITAALLLAAEHRHPYEALLNALMKNGICLYYADLPECISGLLRIRRGIAAIGVNLNHSRESQRLAVAHEFYHFLAGDIDDLSLSCGVCARTPKEIEADRFAAALLLPAGRVRQLLRSAARPQRIAT